MSPSHWKRVNLPRFAPLQESVEVDVLVVGAGMTGITAAYLLKQAGFTVALIERDQCAHVNTGNTTAHLTCVTDLRLTQLVKRFGRDHAQAVWDAGLAAINEIEAIVSTLQIPCEYTRVPAYLHASLESDRDERPELKAEAELAGELGFDAEYVETVPLFGKPGIRFANQAKFHPLMYLAALAPAIPGRGSYAFEHTEPKEFEAPSDDGAIKVTANGHTIRCNYVIMATDVPLMGLSNLASATLLQTKMTGYTSYAIGAEIPSATAPEACFWDTTDPYYYLRIDRHNEGHYAIFGGHDHKTGQVDQTGSYFDELEAQLHRYLPDAAVDRRWSGQVIESHDGLPLIGETAKRQFVATAFSGNGITFGTLAGMMIRDAIAGRKNPWRDLFAPDRTVIRGGVWNYISENLEFPYYMVKDRLKASEGASLQSLPRGQGRILRLGTTRVAAYRDAEGQATIMSPVCPHMGCIVHWNEAASSWDCPCHGSRFTCTGQVLAGPAESPLKHIQPPGST